jgi:hypothetical protein
VATRSAAPGTAARAFAWAGGVLFVCALAYGAYFFIVELGRVTVGGGAPARAVLADVGLFLLFAGHHSVMARAPAKRWLVRHVPPHLERSVFVWTASLLFLLMCLAWWPVPGQAWRLSDPWVWVARFVQAAGVLLTVLSVRLLDALVIAGIRHIETATSAEPPAMSIAGPYRLVRHPIYLGWVLMVAATPDMTAGRLLFAVLSIGYIVVAIPWEERALQREFGQAYRAYQSQVRWRVVPGVY